MKFIHTFWSKPLLNNKFGQFKDSLTNTLFDYACSASFIHKFGEKIVLYADKNGARILSCIPYDEVHIIDKLDDESIHFAAQIKFEALKQCELGDVLIDGDLFLRKREAIDYIKGIKEDVSYSFYEPHTYTLRSKQLVNILTNLINDMSCIDYERPFKLPSEETEFSYMNTSLMKFNNKELLDKYIKQYYYHKDKLNSFQFSGWPDIIIEQRFLTLLVTNNKFSSKPIIENFYIDPLSNQKSLDLGFTHLGSAKSQYLNWVVTMLKENDEHLYEDTFKQLNNILNNEIKLRN